MTSKDVKNRVRLHSVGYGARYDEEKCVGDYNWIYEPEYNASERRCPEILPSPGRHLELQNGPPKPRIIDRNEFKRRIIQLHLLEMSHRYSYTC